MKYVTVSATEAIMRTLRYYDSDFFIPTLEERLIPVYGEEEVKESIQYLISQNQVWIREVQLTAASETLSFLCRTSKSS